MKKSTLIHFLFLALFGTLSVVDGSAQDNIATGITPTTKQNDDAQLLYRNEQEFGALIHSSGWGVNYRRGKHITGYKKRTLELEIVTVKHPKEIKTQVQDIGTKGYFYGKQFSVLFLRGGYGYHKIITGKSDRRGVELRLVTLGGPVIALAKPIYLDIWYPDPHNSYPYVDIRSERYDPLNSRHTPDFIVGRSGYFRGFSEMNFFPGAFLKLGLSFEHSNLDDDIKLLEVGATVDAFYKTIPIMANTKNNQVYLGFYLNIMFGKKWF